MSDPARIDGLSEAVARLLPALERFTRFEGPDLAARRSVWRAALDEPLPATGAGPDAVLETIERVVIPHGLRVGAPGFLGWITTAPTTIGAAAQLAASIATPQRWWISPGNFLEVLALRWLAELLGLPATHQGIFTSGGSMANLVGLAAARQQAGERRGLDPARDGIAALPGPRVYASTEVHHVALRALAVLGMGRRALRMVPLDAGHKPDLDLLRRWIDEDVSAGRTPVAVIASAGEANAGDVDPIEEMADLAHERGAWLHVDGAYGGFGVLDERVRHLYGDLAKADSFAVDPHKWLAAPVGIGSVFVREAALLARTFALEPADYAMAAPPAEGDPGSPWDDFGEGSLDYGPDLAAPARGLVVWAILKEIGAAGMRARVARDLDCARRVAARARASDELELLAEPVLSICCFRYRPPGLDDEDALDALNEGILRAVQARGRAVPSSTRIGGRLAIRPCFINPRSTLADADALVDEVLTVGRALVAASGDAADPGPQTG